MDFFNNVDTDIWLLAAIVLYFLHVYIPDHKNGRPEPEVDTGKMLCLFLA